MNKVLFSLLFTFGIFNFTFAQDDLFDDIDDKYMPNPTLEEHYETPITPQESTSDWDTTFDEVDTLTVVEKTPSPKWEPTFEEAVNKARDEQKPILIYFTGSDWCGPCKRLEQDVFSTDKFIKTADESFVLYKADFPRNVDLVTIENKKMNEQLSTKYNQTSFPTMLFINQYGTTLGRKNGVYMSDSYFYFFDDIIRKSRM